LADIPVLVDTTEKAIRAIALLVGGSWAYLKYARGRTFRKRLETKLQLRHIRAHGHSYLILQVSLKNVGLSKVSIDSEGTALRIFISSAMPQTGYGFPPNWVHIATTSALASHEWIEPGEFIEDIQIVSIPEAHDGAVQCELFVISGETEWSAKDIILVPVSKPSIK
jgi:hypothetical protein